MDNWVTAHATVPEHSLALMEGMSGGKPLLIDGYLFFHGADWLMAIGYPMCRRFSAPDFLEALHKATEQTKADQFFAIAPSIPGQLQADILEKDQYYVLPADAVIPAKLRNPIRKARKFLRIEENRVFTAAHRRLWGEFLEKGQMNDRVAQLYARTPDVMGKGKLVLLDAYDPHGHLCACLLLDYGPQRFVSYILGAHSKRNYIAHAVDALFAEMIERARERNKRFIHLGLGVNQGILRFKKKWGAIPSHSFVMAQWQPVSTAKDVQNLTRTVALAVLRAPAVSPRQALQNEPEQRPFAMLWRVEKQGKVSWLAGTAHFFCHSFENSFRSLFRKVDNVIFEGPLDPQFMAQVDQAGRLANATPLIHSLTEEEITRLERITHGPAGLTARMLGLAKAGRKPDVRWLLSSCRTWYAFFTLWTSFLETRGWRQSVDMEAWTIAQEMEKNVMGMETLEEQLESLESLPAARALNFFRACRTWPGRAKHNMQAYLAGDLERMMGSSAEFPTRTEHIVGRRDQRFRERMRPWLEKGNSAVFVGSAHLVNLRHMLQEDGFNVRQAPFGLWPKLHLRWRDMTRPDGKVKW